MSERTPGPAEIAATIQRDLAEAAYLQAQADREIILGQSASYARDVAKIAAEKAKRTEQFSLAADHEHRIYPLTGILDKDSCSLAWEHLSRWGRMSKDPVEIVLTSPGGYTWFGFTLFDHILAMRNEGIKVTITVRGSACSMAAILLQAADERVMGPGATLLIHKVSAAFEGSLDELMDMKSWLDLSQKRADEIFYDRCQEAARNGTATKPLTKTQIAAGTKRKDWTFGPEKAFEVGLIDRIG